MISQKLCFPLSYNNIDIYYIELDSIKNEKELIEKLSEVTKQVNEINSREYIILHIEGSNITKMVLDEIISFIDTYKVKMKRLGIVGAHRFLSVKLKTQLKKINELDYYFCNDYLKAKDIVVGLIKK